MMKKVLITGINGFIGNCMAKEFIRKGYSVYGTYRSEIRNYQSEIKYYKCDLSDKIEIDETFDVVIHLASQVENSDTFSYVNNTVVATKNLTDFCEKKNIKMIIFMSSIAVYGYTNVEINETSGTKNINTYGMAKLLAESIIKESRVPSKIILRLPRVLGNGANLEHQWLPKLTSDLLANKEIKYFNANLEYNNMMDVSDLIDFCIILIDEFVNRECVETFVLGAEDKKSIFDIVMYLKNYIKSKSKIILLPKRDTTVFSIDIDKAKQYGYKSKKIEQILCGFVDCVSDSFKNVGGN